MNSIFTLFYSCLFGISEYLDEEMLIPKNTSVLIRRVPGRPRLPIVTEIEYYLKPLISLLQLNFAKLGTCNCSQTSSYLIPRSTVYALLILSIFFLFIIIFCRGSER